MYRKCSNDKEDYESVRISPKTMHVVFISGLRGAVSYACANIYPDVGDGKRYHYNSIIGICFKIEISRLKNCNLITQQGVSDSRNDSHYLDNDIGARRVNTDSTSAAECQDSSQSGYLFAKSKKPLIAILSDFHRINLTVYFLSP